MPGNWKKIVQTIFQPVNWERFIIIIIVIIIIIIIIIIKKLRNGLHK